MGLAGGEQVIGLEEAFGIDILNDEAAALTTPRMVIDLVCRKVGAVDAPDPDVWEPEPSGEFVNH